MYYYGFLYCVFLVVIVVECTNSRCFLNKDEFSCYGGEHRFRNSLRVWKGEILRIRHSKISKMKCKYMPAGLRVLDLRESEQANGARNCK